MPLDAGGIALLACAALLAGAINGVAGGGSLVSFPTLLFLGVAPLTANVSNTIGLLPGYVGGSTAYRRELGGQSRRVAWLGALSACGAVAGALLLVHTSPRAFQAIVPWLILVSCLLLLMQPLIGRSITRPADPGRDHRSPALGAAQALAAVYGAFFGAGLSVLTLALLGIFVRDNLQRLNALKGVLSLIVNAVAAVCLIVLANVSWTAVAVMMPASFAGGFAGAVFGRRLDATTLRVVVVAFGLAVAIRLLV